MTSDSEKRLVEENLRLSQAEYLLQHVYLRSQPRFLGLVLGNACNIDCPHCYQAKNVDNLLKPPEIAHQLRKEFMGTYPYLSTLRVQGGEALAYQGFRELVEDVAATVSRPLLSISTNGTLIDEAWAERIVRTPFQNVTISIDGERRKPTPECGAGRILIAFWLMLAAFRIGSNGSARSYPTSIPFLSSCARIFAKSHATSNSWPSTAS